MNICCTELTISRIDQDISKISLELVELKNRRPVNDYSLDSAKILQLKYINAFLPPDRRDFPHKP